MFPFPASFLKSDSSLTGSIISCVNKLLLVKYLQVGILKTILSTHVFHGKEKLRKLRTAKATKRAFYPLVQ